MYRQQGKSSRQGHLAYVLFFDSRLVRSYQHVAKNGRYEHENITPPHALNCYLAAAMLPCDERRFFSNKKIFK